MESQSCSIECCYEQTRTLLRNGCKSGSRKTDTEKSRVRSLLLFARGRTVTCKPFVSGGPQRVYFEIEASSDSSLVQPQNPGRVRLIRFLHPGVLVCIGKLKRVGKNHGRKAARGRNEEGLNTSSTATSSHPSLLRMRQRQSPRPRSSNLQFRETQSMNSSVLPSNNTILVAPSSRPSLVGNSKLPYFTRFIT